MSADPPRLRDDPASPEGLRELMACGAPPPRLDAATKAASAAAVATLAGGSAAAASSVAATVAGTKLWLVIGGLAVTGIVGGGIVVVLGQGSVEVESGPPAKTAVEVEPAAPAPRAATAPELLAPLIARALEEPPPAEPPAPDPHRPAARREASPVEVAAPSAGGLVAEAALLERARGLLSTDPSAALAVTEQPPRASPRPARRGARAHRDRGAGPARTRPRRAPARAAADRPRAGRNLRGARALDRSGAARLAAGC